MVKEATNRTERVLKGTLMSFLQYGTQMLLQAFLAPLVLRLAGQETLGAYALLMQVVGYLAMLDLGFSVTLNRYLAQANGYDDGGRRLSDVLSTARTFLFGANVLISALTLLFALKVDAFFSLSPQVATQAQWGLVLLAAWGIVKIPWTVFGIGLNATQDLAAYNFIGIVGNASRLLLSLGLVFSGGGLVGLMLANVLAEMLSTIMYTVRFRRLNPSLTPFWGIPDRQLFREMIGFGAQAFLINIAWRLVYYTDNIVVGYLYGAAAVSIYYTTQMPTSIGFNIVNRLSDNASPAVNELYAREEAETLRNSYLRLHRFTLLLVLPLAAGLCLLNRSLITLWVGERQYAGDLMTYALAAFALLITVSHASLTFVFASGKIRTLGLVSVLEGVTNLGLSLWLGRRIGLAGVMVATVIANVPTTSYLLAVSLRALGLGAGRYVSECVVPSLLPIAAGCSAALLARMLLPGNGWFAFLVQGSTLVLFHAVTAFRFNLTSSEREWVGTRLRPVFAKFEG